MQQLIESFLQFKHLNQARSERTMQVYGLALRRLVQFFAGDDPLRATNEQLLVFCGPWLHKQGLTDPVSRRTHVAAVREFYRWLHQQRKIDSNPGDVPYPRRPRKIPDTMTLASAEKLMWAPDFETFAGVRDGAMLGLLAGCGLRVSGLVRLNESNIIHAMVDDKERLIIKVLEKGDKERKIPVPPEADLMLRLYMGHPFLDEIDRRLPNGDQVLFVSLMNRNVSIDEYRGERRRMSRNAVLQMIKRYGQSVGIPERELHPHAMRHLYGTELAEDGVDLIARQRLMGHEDSKSTEIYDHMAMRSLTRKSDQANPLAKMRTPVSDLLKQLKANR